MLKFKHVCVKYAIALICLKSSTVASLCPEFGKIQNADVTVTEGPPYKEGVAVTIKCDRGFVGHGNPSIKCLKSGRWSAPIPYCTVSQCRRDLSKVGKDRSCRKPCKTRQDCKGPFKKCECDDWCGKSCFNPDANCPDLSPPENGYIIGVTFLYGYSVSYGCNDGYVLNGPAIRKCRSDRKWSGRDPRCLPFSSCGQPGDVKNSVSIGKVAQGKDAEEGAWPWQALLFHALNHDVAQIYNPKEGFGGGSVIDSKWILTAAHVFDQFGRFRKHYTWKNEFLIAVGMTKHPQPDHVVPTYVNIFEPRRVYRHEKYDGKIFDYDVALIRVGKRLKQSGRKFVVDTEQPDGIVEFSEYIRPVCLPCMDSDPFGETLDITNNFDVEKCQKRDILTLLKPGNKVIVTGFGYKRQKIKPNKLQEGLVEIEKDSTCVAVIQENDADGRYTDRMICAGSANKSLDTDACAGDSGGPLVKQVEASNEMKYWIQVGIVSWGYKCGDKNPGYYISVASVMPWIWNTTRNSEEKWVFANWSDWSDCSTTCGAGRRTRSRACVNEAGENATSANDCDDPTNLGVWQDQACTLGRCYRYTEWSEWSDCSVTCGLGTTTSTRTCIFETGHIILSNLCEDPEGLGSRQSKLCAPGPCFQFTPWTTWTHCSRSCGAGEITRRRRCVSAKGQDAPDVTLCDDPQKKGIVELQSCFGSCFTRWSDWSPCSVQCGIGRMTRTRNCISEQAINSESCSEGNHNEYFQTKPCAVKACGGDEKGTLSYKCRNSFLMEEDICHYNLTISTTVAQTARMASNDQFTFNLHIELSSLVSKPSDVNVIEIKLLHGYKSLESSLNKMSLTHNVNGIIDRFEIDNDKVILYIKNIARDSAKLSVLMKRTTNVKLLPEPVTITVYKYFEPTVQCSMFYGEPSDIRVSCMNDNGLSSKDRCQCAQGGCMTCRTRKEQLESTACLPGMDDNCEICNTADMANCFNMSEVACKSEYVYEISIVNEAPNDTVKILEFEAEINVVYKLGRDPVSQGEVRKFISNGDCFRNCKDHALGHMGKNGQVDNGILRKERTLLVMGSAIDNIHDGNAESNYFYRLQDGDFIERVYPAEKCKGAKVKLENRKCKSKKQNNKAKESCAKSGAIHQSCLNLRILRRQLILGCGCQD